VKLSVKNIKELLKNLTKFILLNPQKMIREDDLKNLSKNFNFKEVMSEIYMNLKNIGFELIKTKFLEQQFYILTSEGKDDSITPSQYGALALIIALSKEIDGNIKLSELKEIFNEVWDTDIQTLIDRDYLRKFDELGIVKVAPLGKAIMKEIINDIKLNKFLDIFN